MGSAGTRRHGGEGRCPQAWRAGCQRRGESPGPSSSGFSSVPRNVRPPALHPTPPLHTPVTCRETLRLTGMALVPHLVNVILKIGRGYNRILLSISYKSPGGLRLSQGEGRFKTLLGAEGGEDPPPDWPEAGGLCPGGPSPPCPGASPPCGVGTAAGFWAHPSRPLSSPWTCPASRCVASVEQT